MLSGTDKHGFAVLRSSPLPELEAVMHYMRHERTGLELVWIERAEANRTFGIAFPTLPEDDTGVFHILEHSVLCGSELYRVKEPFVELMKTSMNTFLNAMTFPDKTYYPISSRNSKDFINLMRVYLDAVFRPLIYEKSEIFRQEGWHYELAEDGTLSRKGVVYNEMRGAFADADELEEDAIMRALYPDTPYRFVSGATRSTSPSSRMSASWTSTGAFTPRRTPTSTSTATWTSTRCSAYSTANISAALPRASASRCLSCKGPSALRSSAWCTSCPPRRTRTSAIASPGAAWPVR